MAYLVLFSVKLWHEIRNDVKKETNSGLEQHEGW